MNRFRLAFIPALLAFGVNVCLAEAPVRRSYGPVEQAIQSVRESLEQSGQSAQLASSGWDIYFNELLAELEQYTATTNENDRLRALGKLFDRSQSIRGSSWPRVQGVGQALDAWLAPRIQVAWAVRQLEDAVTSGTTDQSNRDRWMSFLRDDLGASLASYEGAASVADRVEALEKFHNGLSALRQSGGAMAWGPASGLAQALSSLYERPNVEAIIDFPTAWKLFAQQIITPETLFRKGQTTYITPGPYLGFGLLPSEDGIGFYNQQIAHGYTPIAGFNEQIAADPQGQRATRMYYFTGTTTTNNRTTAYTWIRSHGIDLLSVPEPSVAFSVAACPIAGAGLQRAIAGLIGMTQDQIVERIRQEAYPRVAAEAASEAQALASERTAAAEADLDSKTAPYLRGNGTAVYDRLAVVGLTLRSQPDLAQVQGNIQYNTPKLQLFADVPQPPQFQTMAPGITADLHLPSILTNMSHGYLRSGDAATTNNIVVESGPAIDDQQPGPGVKVHRNVEFAEFLQIVDRTQSVNDPRQQTFRVKKPERDLIFGADTQGNLVVVIRDLQLDVPVPPNAPNLGGGERPRVYRIVSPRAEIVFNATVTPAANGQPMKIDGKIVSFDTGPEAKVLAILNDEGAALPLGAIPNGLVLGILRARIQSQTIDIPLNNLPLEGFTVSEVSAIDPTGWLRIVLNKL